MVESKINVDFLANTSDFSKGVTRVNEMVETLDGLMEKISRNASKPLFDSSSLRSINDMVSSLKQAEQLVNKVKSTSTTSKRNRNANRSSGQNPFQTALRDDANKQIAQLRAQLNRERSTIQNSSKLIPKYTQSRGKVRTNEDFDTYVTENKQNRAGTLRREQAREDNSSIRNIMTAMDRYTNNIRNNDGRITAVQKRAYNSTLDKAGSLLDIDENGNSGYIQKLQEEKAGINARSNRANARLTELQNSGLPKEAIEEESANLVNDIEEAAKALGAVENSLKKADDAMAKFRDLQSAGSEIREVTPSRRSAFAVYAGISAARGMFSSGESTLRAEQADTRSLTAANGTYDSYRMRRISEKAGLKYGISGSEMLAAENQYIQGAGFQSNEDVKNAGIHTGILAKTTGSTVADSTSLTGTYASTVNGASSSDLSQFQHTFEGALDKSGMTKYGASQVKALDKLLSTVASQNGGSLTKEQANNLANLQGTLASSGNKALMGEAGANTISTINSAITGGDNAMMRSSLIMSNPGRYGNGMDGWVNQQFDSAEGLSNKNVQEQAFGDNAYSRQYGERAAAALEARNYGVSPQAMLAARKAYQKNGGKALSNKQLEELGVSSESNKLDKQRSSMEGKNDRNDASQQAAETQLGQWTNWLKASTGALVADVAGLTTFGTVLRGVTTTLGSVAPIKAGRMVASTFAGGTRNTSKYAPNNGTASGTPTTWNERLSNKINTGGGKVANYLRNTQVGQGVSGAATSFLGSGLVTGTTAKATKLSSAVANSSKLNAFRSTTTGLLEGGSNILGKVAPYAYGAYEGYQAITDKENRGSHIGSGIGNIAGTALGGFFGGPIGMLLGGLAGGAIGNSVGSLFDNKAVDKDDQANTNKKSAIEKQREKNIKDDTTLTDKQLRALNKNLNGGSGSGTRSSTTGTSPYDKALAEQGKSKNNAKASSNTVVVSGTINHTGSVADTSQLQANTQNALNNLLSVPSANEQTRK